ncbi:MAG: molybdopterin oxidoreductase family protein [Chloroflexia bacterium]
MSKPLVRRDGRLVPATWDEALDLVTSKLQEHRGATAVVASPKLTNEENYLLQKVTRLGLGTNNIDWDGRATESVALGVLHDMLGYPAQTNNLIDTRQKAGCVLLVGDSIYETHPVYGYQLQRMVRLMDKKVVVISPRWVKMCEWATLWLAPRPGTEEILVHGIARVIADARLHDEAFLDGRTENSADYIQSLAADAFSLAEVSRMTGVPTVDIVAAAYLYATGGTNAGPSKLPEPTHPSNLPMTRNGHASATPPVAVEDAILSYKVERPEKGFPPSTIVFPAAGPYTLPASAVAALTNLALVTGNIGRPGAGVNPLVSDSNCLGANDMGCQPGYFPGYRPVNADNAREMENLWAGSKVQSPPPPGSERRPLVLTAGSDEAPTPEISGDPGLSLREMIAAAESGDLKAMWVVGSNPVLGTEEANSNRVREALKKLDFLVVQDIFINETGEFADVILPAASYAEKEGTYTNTERRIQRVRQAIEPVGVTKPDAQIIGMLGKRLGLDMPTDPKQVMEEIGRVVPEYAGVTYARLDMTEFVDDDIPMPAAVSYKQLKLKSLLWPCPERLHAGTPVLYTEGFATRSGKAIMSTAPQPAFQAAEPAGGDVLMATVGFALFPYRTGTLSRQSFALSRVEPDPRLHLNSRDAARLGIGHQLPVQVTFEGIESPEPIYAVSLIHDRVPEGRAFFAITMEQAGTSRGVREARQAIQDGERKAVPIRVQPAPQMATRPAQEIQPVATANVLDVGRQPL